MERIELENKGKDIEDILKAMDIPCVLQECVNTQFSERYEFMLKNAKSFSLVPKAITVLKTCFHTNEISLVDSKNDYKGISRIPFAIEFKTKSAKNVENFSKHDLDLDNKYNAFLGIDQNHDPIYINLANNSNIIIAGTICSNTSKMLNNMIESLIMKNTNETLQFIVFDSRKLINREKILNFLYGKSLSQQKKSYITDNYCGYDEERLICDIFEKRKKGKVGKAHLSIVFTDISELSDWSRKDLHALLEDISKVSNRLNISLVIFSQIINSKVFPTQLKGRFLTRICFKSNTPSESTSILGHNKASKIQDNDVAIIKNIETAEEKEFRVVDLVDSKKNETETTKVLKIMEAESSVIGKYINLKNKEKIIQILQNYFKRCNKIKTFELFAGKFKKTGNHYQLAEIIRSDSEEFNEVLKIISNSYTKLNKGKEIFDDYQIIKNELENVNNISDSIDEETFDSLKNLVMLYDSLCGQGLLATDSDTKHAFYILSYEIYANRLKTIFQDLTKRYGVTSVDNNTIIEKLYCSDKSIMEIKRYIALKEFAINNELNYSFDLWLEEVDEMVESCVKNYKQKKMIENLMNDTNEEKSIRFADIDLMSGYEFEEFIAKMFSNMGYGTKVTKSSGDQGIDVIATKDDYVIAIQAKCYSGVVGNHAVMEAVAGMKYYKADKCMVITNSSFTKSAQELAKENNVELWDRQTLKEKLEEI